MKRKFEIDCSHAYKTVSSVDKDRKTVRTAKASPRTLEYENLYNDEFWRQEQKQAPEISLKQQGKGDQKLPFFQQFRPDTSYKWSPTRKNTKAASTSRPEGGSEIKKG